MKKFLLSLFRLALLLVLALNYATAAQAAPGALDTTFKGTGKVKTDFGFGADSAIASAVQADGKILTLGFAPDFGCALTRYNAADGALDYSFGEEGKLFIFGCNARALLLQADGKIVIAGTSYEQITGDFQVVRLNPDGSADASFGVNGRVRTPIGFFNDEGWAAALQADGKIVVAGRTFNSIGNEGNNVALVRYNPNGSLDTTFDGDGKVTTDIDSLNNEVTSVAVQTDGKIVVAGSSYNDSTVSRGLLVRYNADGSLDASFDGDGIINSTIGSRSGFSSVAVQSDGRILAAGSSFIGSNSDFAVARYNSDGSPDTTFETDGEVVVSFSLDYEHSRSIVVQANQKIVVFGTTLSPVPMGGGSFAAFRFNADGSLDTSFGAGGAVMTSFAGPYNSLSSGIIQPDGKLLAVGTAGDSFGGNFALARHNPDGSLDTSFDTDGKVTTSVAYRPSEARAVLVQSDNKIVTVGQVYKGYTGTFTMAFGLARYNPDGSLDNSFGEGGLATTIIENSSFANAAAIQPDGKIIVAGFFVGPAPSGIALARYNPDGTLDTTFDGDGIVKTRVGSEEARAHSIAIQADGKIVGGQGFSAGSKAMIFRYNADGSLDNSFGSGGKVISPGIYPAASVAIQTDGKIVATGRAIGENLPFGAFAVARHNTDGSLDASYGFDGVARASFGVNVSEVSALAVQPDGKIVSVGSVYNGNGRDIGVARFDTDGAPDSTFDGDGTVITPVGVRDDDARAVLVQPDGKIIVAGETTVQISESIFSFDFAVIRYNGDGSLDNSWGTNGITNVDFTNSGGDRAFAAALDSGGRVIVAGSADIKFGTARLQGDITPTASIRGRVVTPAGFGIKDARVTVTGDNLSTRIYAYTNPFGYYQIEGIPIGETYQIIVSSKRHTFSQPTLTVLLRQNYENANFTGTVNSASALEKVQK